MLPMSESSQNGRPVIFWISMQPSATDRGDPVDAPPSCGPSHHDASPPSAGSTTRPRRRSGVFISYSVLQVIAVLVCGGVVGLLIALEWPQVGGVLETICAIIGAGLAILDIIRRQDGNPGSERDRA
jgi:hypothetical protein